MLKLSAPGKTFLLGEYYVTQPGEAYVITTNPRFELHCEPAAFALINIHPNSPAGKFVQDHLNFFSNYKLTFIDPYHEMGGFGASTAQFLLVYQLLHRNYSKIINLHSLLECYLSYAWDGQGIAPSGADLLAQTSNNLCYVTKHSVEITSLIWPFPNLEFHIVHTHNKLATHTHLASLEQPNTTELQNIFKATKDACTLSNDKNFCAAINQYYLELTKLNLVADNTLKLIELLRSQNHILAAKGCGAMGADTLLLITEKNQSVLIKKLCKQLNLTYIANNQTIAVPADFSRWGFLKGDDRDFPP